MRNLRRRDPLERARKAHAFAKEVDRRVGRRSAEAKATWQVTADAWEEAGRPRLVRRIRAAMLALEGDTTERDRLEIERLFRIHRRFGMSPRMALFRAREKLGWRIIGEVGDVGWPAYDGGPILRNRKGDVWMEYIEPITVRGNSQRYFGRLVQLDRRPMPDWYDVEGMARFAGMRPTALRRMWSSSNISERANARIIDASYNGWEGIEFASFNKTYREVRARYAGIPKKAP